MPGQRSTIGGPALVAVTIGAVLAYSGLKGKRLSGVARSIISGDNPQKVSQTAPIRKTQSNEAATLSADSASVGTIRAVIVNNARNQLGKPYGWAKPIRADEANPSSFDCSGLTMWCYYKVGIALAHYTGTQYSQLAHLPFAQARPGDLVFYSNGITIYHVAIYIGNSQIIEAPDFNINVRIRTISATDKDLVSTVGVVPNV